MGDGSCLWLSQMWCWELPDGDVGVLGGQCSGRLESWLLALAAGPARTGLGLLAGAGARRSSGLLGNCCWGLRFSWGLDFVACHGPGRAAVLQRIALCRPGALTAAWAL